MPVLAAASSGVGKRQRGVKNIETMMAARFGMVGQAGKRAHEQQRLGCVAERVGCMPARVDERGDRVNYDIRLI